MQICKNSDELRAVQRLRYEVFVAEKGASGPMVDTTHRLERDAFDPYCSHLILRDLARPADDQVVGTYRLMTGSQARHGIGFYSANEYDLSPILKTSDRVVELGRSCLHPAYRGGEGMMLLWRALAEFIKAEDIEIMFGVASFAGTDPSQYYDAFSILAERHLAPPEMRVAAKPPGAISFEKNSSRGFDRKQAVQQMPALLKAYLRLGAWVGDGAFVDHDFNCIDVCIVLHQRAIDGLRRQIYGRRV